MRYINIIFQKKYFRESIAITLLFTCAFTFYSCKKFVEVDSPKTQVSDKFVFSDEATATAALTGIYSGMAFDGYASGGASSITYLGGLASDELRYHTTGERLQFYNNSLTANNSVLGLYFWTYLYRDIYRANAVIEGLNKSTTIKPSVKNELLGEANFVRAFCHFYLVNLFGDIPLILSTDYRSNATISRTAKQTVYQQIINDLKNAQVLLSSSYYDATNVATTDRVRPNKWAATALLSRVYLYVGDWANAEMEASNVIDQTSLYSLLPDLTKVFLKNSKESIWQLMPNVPGFNSNDGRNFVLVSTPTAVSMSGQLSTAFELNDSRKNNWVGSLTVGATTYFFPYKYKIRSGTTLTEYSTVLRLSEQYLIRAEARAQQNKISEAQSDLNLIRNRASLANTTANDKSSLLNAILHERQVELFSEWGHRWFDLKRTYNADLILAPLKNSNWQSTDVLFPIPLTQIENDPNITQNAGY